MSLTTVIVTTGASIVAKEAGSEAASEIGEELLETLEIAIEEQFHSSQFWVGSVVDYAAAQEIGTSDMAPQPYLGPSMQSVDFEPAAEKFFEQVFKEGKKKAMDSMLFNLAKQVRNDAKDFAPIQSGNLRDSIALGQSLEAMRSNSASNAQSLS
jgi:hypothetical protein